MDNVCSFNRNPFSPQTTGALAGSGRHSVEQRRAFQIPATGAMDRPVP
jgi:hypothetical protein